MAKGNVTIEQLQSIDEALQLKGIVSNTVFDTSGYAIQTIQFDEYEERAFRLHAAKRTLDILPRGENDEGFFHEELVAVFPTLMKEWEEFALTKKFVFLQFQQMWLENRLTEEIRERLLPDFYLIDAIDISLYRELKLVDKISNSYLKEIGIEKLPGQVKQLSELMAEIERAHLTYPLFYVTGNGNLARTYYYEGHEGTLEVNMDEKNLKLVDKELNIVVPVQESFKETIATFLTTVEKRKRLENLYEAPMYHMKRWIGRNLSEGGFRYIYNTVRTEHDPEEIELYFARDFKPEYHQGISSYKIVKIFDMYFLYEHYASESSIVMSKNEEEIKQHFLGRIFQPFE